MLAIVTAATKNYLHAWAQCMRGIASAASHHQEAHFVFCTDKSKEAAQAEEVAKRELPEGWKIACLKLDIGDDQKDYKEAAQLRIAALQGAGFAFARSKIRADMVWSVESDNVVPANSLKTLEWVLGMPDSYYDVAAATYPNGLFLGGFGTPQNPICEDFLPHERVLPARLKKCYEVCKERLDKAPSEKEGKRMGRLMEKIRKCPSDGNVFVVNGKHGWRRRGWMEHAYPAIGKGAVVPSDWCGLGCTLMSKKALELADFTGYVGKGTQDLFLCWNRWYPAGLRIACVPHVVCDHIKKQGNKIVHYRAFHETQGECKGHLRCVAQDFIDI
jgi:hypothetical protein